MLRSIIFPINGPISARTCDPQLQRWGDHECQCHLPPCEDRNQSESSAQWECGHFPFNHVTHCAWDFVVLALQRWLLHVTYTWPQPQGINTFLLYFPHIQGAIAAFQLPVAQLPWLTGWGGTQVLEMIYTFPVCFVLHRMKPKLGDQSHFKDCYRWRHGGARAVKWT